MLLVLLGEEDVVYRCPEELLEERVTVTDVTGLATILVFAVVLRATLLVVALEVTDF